MHTSSKDLTYSRTVSKRSIIKAFDFSLDHKTKSIHHEEHEGHEEKIKSILWLKDKEKYFKVFCFGLPS